MKKYAVLNPQIIRKLIYNAPRLASKFVLKHYADFFRNVVNLFHKVSMEYKYVPNYLPLLSSLALSLESIQSIILTPTDIHTIHNNFFFTNHDIIYYYRSIVLKSISRTISHFTQLQYEMLFLLIV